MSRTARKKQQQQRRRQRRQQRPQSKQVPRLPERLEESSRVVEVEGGESRLRVVERPKDQLVAGGFDEELLADLVYAPAGTRIS